MRTLKKWIEFTFGKRILKTAVSVFLTAFVCQWLGWPVIFAVIAAIVSIEPTVNSSIKKGIIRLPAAAIGAAFAMLFDYLFGQVPLSFALSALFTIYVCHLLRWDDAIIIATLTSVAMISITYDHFLLSFFTRIGTTAIGIIISTIVNYFLLPPNFTKQILYYYENLATETHELLTDILNFQLNQEGNRQILQVRLSHYMKGIERTSKMIAYQREEQRYRREKFHESGQLNILQQKVDLFQKLSFHIGDILSLVSPQEEIRSEDKKTLLCAWKLMKGLLDAKQPSIVVADKRSSQWGNKSLDQAINKLYLIVHEQTKEKNNSKSLAKSASIAFELITIYSIFMNKVALDKK
jgi:uncharacterized membrane protein YgaE (UPF0421/DUF939 family)